MIARQISVFAENKPGSLARVTRVLNREKINIRATTISTSDAFGVINLIVDDPEAAYKALTAEGIMVTMKDVLAVLIDDKPGGLDRLIQLLYNEKLNINNAYGFVLEAAKSAIFVLDIEQMQKALEIIKKAGFKVLDTEGLSKVEPFHYSRW
ncbi:MAG: ACT domain-containing protein [Syntrophaceae bacterium]